MMWTHYDTNLSPAAVATIFAATMFEEVREVKDCSGTWKGRTYHGSFGLVGGIRRYRLTGDAEGQWTVNPED